MSSKLKQIAVDEGVYLALKNQGQAGDSFNDVVKNLLLKAGAFQICGRTASTGPTMKIFTRTGERTYVCMSPCDTCSEPQDSPCTCVHHVNETGRKDR